MYWCKRTKIASGHVIYCIILLQYLIKKLNLSYIFSSAFEFFKDFHFIIFFIKLYASTFI